MMPEKQINPEADQHEDVTEQEETILEKEAIEVAKHDPDEASHLTKPTISEENKQQDADDAVHRTVTPTIVTEDIEKEVDLDELSHGQ